MKIRFWINLFFLAILLWPLQPVLAQESEPGGPVYVVQSGDTLWGIAQRFGVSLDALAVKNGISDPSQLPIGTRLVIPGLEGLQGVLGTTTVPLGESLTSLSYRHALPVGLLARLNHYTSPHEVYAGSTLILPQDKIDAADQAGGRMALHAGQSWLEVTIQQRANPWALLAANHLPAAWMAQSGQVLFNPAGQAGGPGSLPPEILNLAINTPLVQGQTVSLQVQAASDVELAAAFLERDLSFILAGEHAWVVLQGVHAMTEPGLYPFVLTGRLPDGTEFGFTQQVYIWDGGYPYDPVLVVDAETIDLAVTVPEDEQWRSLTAPITPEKYWSGAFQVPVPAYLSECYPSMFGHRRSYNGSPYTYFHTGLDFCGQAGVEIYAAAPGRVVFADFLTVRGNATVIDHGWGIYTAYAHQSEILVSTGDWVDAGTLIGAVGSTGRVTGPHLHFEVIVGGVQVDPLQWLGDEFP
ncbi:MAG: peptidoglycan DD-metalloendopeptidase family protein [Anaerolineales bacterium]|nr:peptidoglycan DD-metalloendopeptidase family protein [Anaerolineales bacterium]